MIFPFKSPPIYTAGTTTVPLQGENTIDGLNEIVEQ